MKLKNGFKFSSYIIFSFFFIAPILALDLVFKNESEIIIEKGFPFSITEEDASWIDSVINNMSIREKCAQLVFPAIPWGAKLEDASIVDNLLNLVRNEKVGGFISFEATLKDQIQLVNLLQEAATIPLIISSDFERGVGSRIKNAPEFPSNMALAAIDDEEFTYRCAKVAAIQSKAIGVTQIFAPLVDINDEPDNPIINNRSFSQEKDLVIKHSKAYIRGANNSKILTTAKHFPGHGSTIIDSHDDLPFLSRSKESFENNELLPFIAAINEGVGAIMVGHLETPAFENSKGIPATLSKRIVADLLTAKLGFNGIIITDAMNMKSLTKYFTTGEAAVMAIKAGIDVLLFPNNDIESIDALEQAVKSGELSIERINHSVRKILASKRWLGLHKDKFIEYETAFEILNKKEHKRLIEEAADKSITLVKDELNAIPLQSDNNYSAAILTLSYSDLTDADFFSKEIGNKFARSKIFNLWSKCKEKEYIEALEFAKNSDIIILSVYLGAKAYVNDDKLFSSHKKLIGNILKLNKPLIAVNFGNPYFLKYFPELPVYLCAYGRAHCSQRAMLRALFGDISITGRLPLDIPNTPFRFKSGISKIKNHLIFSEEEIDSLYNFSKVDSLMNKGVIDKIYPGAVLLITHKGKVVFHKAFGRYEYDASSPKMNRNVIFDLASVSKVLGTTLAAMKLYDEGLLDLNKKVAYYISEFGNKGKEKISVKNLLLHNSGLIAYREYYKTLLSRDEVIASIMNDSLCFQPGEKYLYSDLGMIILQNVIEKISGLTLDEYLNKKIYIPLNLKRTMYNPPTKYWHMCAPTEKDSYWRLKTIQGRVHDETAYLLKGIAGNAGLFSTAAETSVLLQTLLQNGVYNGTRIFDSSTVQLWTSRQSSQSSRALGWDTKSPSGSSAGLLFSDNSFGHTGFTGTSVWIDKNRELSVVLFTNRINPTRNNSKITNFRPKLHDAIARSIDYD